VPHPNIAAAGRGGPHRRGARARHHISSLVLCWNESAWRWDSAFGNCGLAQYCKRRVPRNHCSGVLVALLTWCICPATAHALGHSRVLHCPGPWNASQGPVEGLSELRSSMTSWGRAHPRRNKSRRLSYPNVPADSVSVWSRPVSPGAFEAEAVCMLRGAHSSQRGPHGRSPSIYSGPGPYPGCS